MGLLKRLRIKLELPLVRAGRSMIAFLPRRVIVLLARWSGALCYSFSPRLRRIGMANLDLVFGGSKSPAQKRRILRRSIQSFALVMLDLFWFSRRPRERMVRYMKFGPDKAGYFNRRAQVCVTAHLGNWELLGRTVSILGFPISSVATPLKNPAVDALLNQARQLTGQIVVPRQGAIKALLRILREGGKVALLLDQNTLPSEGGTFAEFFGVPATVSGAAITLAHRAGAEIVFGFCCPQGDGSYLTHFSAPLFATAQTDPEELTRQIAAIYEDAIRKFPEFWLWTYKRWKFIRPGDSRDRYPFYARPLPVGEIS